MVRWLFKELQIIREVELITFCLSTIYLGRGPPLHSSLVVKRRESLAIEPEQTIQQTLFWPETVMKAARC